jgi:hypothetical protein
VHERPASYEQTEILDAEGQRPKNHQWAQGFGAHVRSLRHPQGLELPSGTEDSRSWQIRDVRNVPDTFYSFRPEVEGLLDQAIGTRTEGPIFLSPAGKAVPNVSRTCGRLRDNAGLPRDLVLCLARHECGTKICREKGIEYARRLLGHANISTTQWYMHLDERELADAQDLVE